MQKPKGAKPVFLAHFLHGQGAVSQRRVDDRGTVGFDVVFVRARDGNTAYQATGFDTADTARFHAMLDKTDLLAAAQQKAGPFDALKLAATAQGQLDLPQILSLKLLAEYTGAALVYASNMATYLASPANARFRAEYSLDLYRQALGFHDLPNMARLIAEDAPIIPPYAITRHTRETIFDAMFHMARRIGQRKAAFEFLSQSWVAKHTLGRAQILMDEAAFYQQSPLIVQIAAFLDAQGQLTARNMAQLTVAQQRLGQTDAAMATFARLSAQKGEKALTAKIASFLGVPVK